MDRNKSSQSSIVKLVETFSVLTALWSFALVLTEFHWSAQSISSIYRKCEETLIWKTGKEVSVQPLYVTVRDVIQFELKFWTRINKCKILLLQRCVKYSFSFT